MLSFFELHIFPSTDSLFFFSSYAVCSAAGAVVFVLPFLFFVLFLHAKKRYKRAFPSCPFASVRFRVSSADSTQSFFFFLLQFACPAFLRSRSWLEEKQNCNKSTGTPTTTTTTTTTKRKEQEKKIEFFLVAANLAYNDSKRREKTKKKREKEKETDRKSVV